MLVDIDHRAPFGKLCPQLLVLLQSFTQAIETFGHPVTGTQRQRFGPFVYLDAGNDSPAGQQFGEGNAILGALAQGLVKQNDPADRVLDAVGREQNLTVAPARFFSGLHLDGFKSFLDGGVAFVCCQYAFLIGDDGCGHGLEFFDIHGLSPQGHT